MTIVYMCMDTNKLSNSRCTHGKYPMRADKWNGVMRLKLSMKGSAPASSSSSMQGNVCPITAAWRAVFPTSSWRDTLTLGLLSRTLSGRELPCREACMTGVEPSNVCAFTSAPASISSWVTSSWPPLDMCILDTRVNTRGIIHAHTCSVSEHRGQHQLRRLRMHWVTVAKLTLANNDTCFGFVNPVLRWYEKYTLGCLLHHHSG